jgi:polyprenyldihydroxybenzoate methyltransferase / 3-demethylubiquinol 3-O-methyltransferase
VIYPSRKLASDALSGLRVLDVGCGAGILTEALAHLHADVVGIDASESLIDLAQRNSERFNYFTRKRLTYVCETIEDHAYNYPEHYDVVVLSEVLEHVADKDTFLKNCVAALKVSDPQNSQIDLFSLIYTHF